MRKAMLGVIVGGTVALAALPAFAAGTVRIGLILPFSGSSADTGAQMDHAIKLFQAENGTSVAGKKIEILSRDSGGINPALAKRLSQELIVRDHADLLAGFVLTPNALAGGDVSKAAQKFMVVMNAQTSVITRKSPYMTRTSVTTPQLNETFGRWAVAHDHVKTVFTMVSDYGPGIDAEQAFQKGFKAAGGKVVGSVRIPVENPDFSSFMRRAKDSGAQALYIWIPGGSQPAAFGKAMAESGIDPQKTAILGQDALTYDSALKSMGDASLGIITVGNYSPELKNKENEAFVKKYVSEFGRNPDIFSIGGWDGMHLIYAALEKTAGNTSGEALIDAAKGMHWDSPRGPVSIDPATRDIVENVYIRKVEKVDGKPRNVVLDVIHDVKNPVD